MRFRALIRKLLIPVTLLAAALFVPAGASGQVLNLSTDLVKYGIASSNMLPNISAQDAQPLFQDGVLYASTHGYTTVTAERGAYYFNSRNSLYEHVILNQISNLTVDLNHSDLHFAYGNTIAISISGGTNLTLRNFTVDYVPLALPFTELSVTSVDTSGSKPTISFTPVSGYSGYPLPSALAARESMLPKGYVDDGFYAYVFRDGQELADTGRMMVSAPINDTKLTLSGTEPWATPAWLTGKIDPGDIVVLELRAGAGSIYASKTTNLKVQNVSIYSSGFIGVFIVLSSGTTVDHVQVIPRPGTGRLISTNADGIHLGNAGANNIVTNNTIKGTCDDAIAMDGEWYAIVASGVSSDYTTTVPVTPMDDLETGQQFDFINIDDALISGTSTITAVSPPTAKGVITLTISPAIAGLRQGFGVTPHDPTLRGYNTVISDNVAQEITFGRGIYPAGVDNIQIHDNSIEATNRSGIVVEQDEALDYDYKTGPSSHINIFSNVVDRALDYGTPFGVVTDAASIYTVAYDENGAWLNTQSLSDIYVKDNFVTGGIRTGIRLENVNGGEVSGNTVLGNNTAPDSPSDHWYLPPCNPPKFIGSNGCETLKELHSDFKQAISVINSNLFNYGNVTTGTAVTNHSFADDSVRFAPSSIVVARGQNFTTTTAIASGPTLPLSLAGVTVDVQDSTGMSRAAGLYFASPTVVEFVMPAGTATGVATVTVGSQTGGALVSTSAPGLFPAQPIGGGVALATAVRYTPKGPQIFEPVYQCITGPLLNTCTALPLDLGAPGDTTLVTFQGTGIVELSSPGKIVAEVGDVLVNVEAAGKVAGAGPGWDYVTLKIPHTLAGSGLVPVTITDENFTSNAVDIDIK